MFVFLTKMQNKRQISIRWHSSLSLCEVLRSVSEWDLFFFFFSFFFLPTILHPQLWRNNCFVIRSEVKADHVYGTAGVYLYVTPRQMSRCFITLSALLGLSQHMAVETGSHSREWGGWRGVGGCWGAGWYRVSVDVQKLWCIQRRKQYVWKCGLYMYCIMG